MIRVLVVDDSPVIRELLKEILSEAPDISIAGFAENGEQATALNESLRPDVITMDVTMPVKNGLTATKEIMRTRPAPIIIVSSMFDPADVEASFIALEAGAVAVVEKPGNYGSPQYRAAAKKLVTHIRLMSELKLVGRKEKSPASDTAAGQAPQAKTRSIVGIGASTGGPTVVKEIIEKLPGNFAAPILLVQHLSEGFADAFATWLNKEAKVTVKTAENNETALPGHCYVASTGCHLGITAGGILMVIDDAPVHGHRPSVGFLFESLAASYNANAVGVLLSGMGDDGSQELLTLKKRGALTIAQNEETSLINGMPGTAVKLGAAEKVLSPQEIAEELLKIPFVS